MPGEVSLAVGAIQTGVALANLLKKRNVPKYDVTPQVSNAYADAMQRAKYGYTGNQTASFRQDLSRNNNQQYSKAVGQFGNQLSGATTAGVNFGNLRALNEFYKNDATLMGQNVRTAYSMADKFQRISDMNTTAAIQNYNQNQNAFGQALQAGISNLAYGTNAQLLGKNGGATPDVNPVTGQPATNVYDRNAAVGYNPPKTNTPAQQENIYGAIQQPEIIQEDFLFDPLTQYATGNIDKTGTKYGKIKY